MSHTLQKIALLALAVTLPAMPAQALRLDNCDSKPHTVMVFYPGHVSEIKLEPGISQNIYGVPIKLHSAGKTIDSVRWDDEYCVWEDGKLRIQRRGFKRRR